MNGHDQDAQAEQLKARISAGQDRAGKRAATAVGGPHGALDAGRPSPPDTRTLLAKTADDHPLALLAGSLIMGVVAANLLRASWGRKVASRLLGAVAVVGELGAGYGNKTLEAAAEAGRSGQERLTKLGDAVAEESAEVRRRATQLSAQARRRAIALASEAADEAREAGGSALKRLGKLSGRT